MLPGPRTSTGRAGSDDGRGQGAEPRRPVALTRTSRGWSVVSPAGVEHAAGLIEGLSLADLVAEEFGEFPDPDRSACRSARGGPSRSAPGEGSDPGDADPSSADPVAARLAELERTVRQLEHALSARVATERAIGVLAERTGTGPRQAFEALRRDSRTSGRPVAEIAREVLATLSAAADGRS